VLAEVVRQNTERKQTVQIKEEGRMHVWNQAISAKVRFLLKVLKFIPDLHALVKVYVYV
jgi:hypothetical protein